VNHVIRGTFLKICHDRPGLRAVWLGLAFCTVVGFGSPQPVGAQQDGFDSSRQVTLFGIQATPNSDYLDPKLKPIGPQLRRLFPNHGFKLLGVETQRITVGQSLPVVLGESGYEAHVQLVTPLDINGKTQLRFELDQNSTIDFATLVTTPLNQLFFLEKRFPDGSRLVMGIGVRP
jgi:hypothetical protein